MCVRAHVFFFFFLAPVQSITCELCSGMQRIKGSNSSRADGRVDAASGKRGEMWIHGEPAVLTKETLVVVLGEMRP